MDNYLKITNTSIWTIKQSVYQGSAYMVTRLEDNRNVYTGSIKQCRAYIDNKS